MINDETTDNRTPASGARKPQARRSRRGPLAIAALGVVFGDLGTSPLYTLKTCFITANAAPATENVLGIISLLIWTLIFVVCLKYISVLMRVDHDGEGGILALLALAAPPKLLGRKIRAEWLVWVVVIGAAMLLGDGMITPAISVISALEGLDVATKAAHPLIVPLSAGILLALFAIQSRGTEKVGFLFGPAMLVWFAAIGASGACAISAHPEILAAADPRHALWFVAQHGRFGFLILGAIVLCVTGAEALYADLSHFGRGPITLAWYAIVFPTLLLNYVGQGAAILADPKALDSPFYALTPGWTLVPMVIIATAGTIIASQSLISGAFTLAEQAIALNLSPRFDVRHTSEEQRGQVYVPFMNWLIAAGCLLLVVIFQSSDRLAAAYGLAVACTMAATSIAFYQVAVHVLRWKRSRAFPLVAIFLTVDGSFVLAGLPKFLEGAWIPLAISAVVTTIAITWLEGRRTVARSLAAQQQPVAEFLAQHQLHGGKSCGTMVLLTGDPTGVPFVNRHRWILARLDDENVVLMTFVRAPRPYVPESERVVVERLADRFTRVSAAFGYMEQPRIAPIMQACAAAHLTLDNDDTSFVYADPKIIPLQGGVPRWQRILFDFLQRVSRPLPDDLMIKPERRVELGVEVDL